MLFAGFALFLNGVSYFVKSFDRKALGIINLFAASLMAVNTIFGVFFAPDISGQDFSNAAAGCAFALNFAILGVFHVKGLGDFSLFGWFSFLMCLFSASNVIHTIVDAAAAESVADAFAASWLFIYLWSMWAVLWGQAFVASGLKVKAVDKLSPYIILANAAFSLLVPAVLILFEVLPL